MKTIAICSSVAFYRQVIAIAGQLEKLGFSVIIPQTARKMKATDNFNVEQHKTWYQNKADYHIKTKLMMDHFNEVVKSDAILVLNYEKHGMQGYIGGNVLMKMTIALYFKKPIFIYDQISEDLPIKEEIYGLNPVFIAKDLKRINEKLSNQR